uniref:Uncharacterized protein n=1 Tax=Ciona intestinalis TaxID=7719 RepID=F7B3F9_CIOIN
MAVLGIAALVCLACLVSGQQTYDSCRITCPAEDGTFAPICDCKTPVPENMLIQMATREYIKTNAAVHYDVTTDHNVVYDIRASSKISKIFDQGFLQAHMIQNNPTQQPTLSLGRQNGRRFISFDGLRRKLNANINLDDQNDINVFIVYKITAYNADTAWVRNGLFGNDNGHYDKFITFFPNGDMMVPGVSWKLCQSQYISNRGKCW